MKDEKTKIGDLVMASIRRLDNMKLSEYAYDEIYRLVKAVRLYVQEETRQERIENVRLFNQKEPN